ncbi:glycosyl transferase family 90 [Sphingobacterium bambusae]|uniref:Glycosyl transferase family 90 n=1 Tax=Sphingobacterium bambusae TaxID=662858 RepID=A0ABW6BDL7_9SPHI|nr:glycosyl transferase family 90 [Sphingobacterium bambusae]WPL47386.1 glycosyl transferase family 90 [Sphingobacterium bambusae]
MNFKQIFLRNKNNKFFYYLGAVSRALIPAAWARRSLADKLRADWGADQGYIEERVNYYNKLSRPKPLSTDAIAIAEYKIPERIRVYYFDSMEYLRFFDPAYRFQLIPGDVTHIPDFPALVKSRPIAGDNENSVLLKLDKSRHFNFIKDNIRFEDKKDKLVGRSGFSQSHRQRFFDRYAGHPLCDLAKATKSSHPNFLSIAEHLDYKFILALEGNDVATNLKWIMSSSSIAVMPKPTYETWFMEGCLIPDVHYICISDDFSDLESKLNYYIAHQDAALRIVKEANAYMEQFKNKKREDAISLLLLEKYFRLTH